MEEVKNFVLNEDGTILETIPEEIFAQNFVDDQYIPTIHVKTMTNGDENVAVIESYNTYNDAKSYPTVDIVDEDDEEPISPQEAYYDIQYPETKTTRVLMTQNRGQAQFY